MPLFARDTQVVPPVPVAEPTEPEVQPVHLPGAPVATVGGRRGLGAHRDFLLGTVRGLRPLGVGLLDAAGLTLCESIVADLDLPTFTAATTDGWAVRAANLAGASTRLPVVLPVVGKIGADGHPGGPLAAGTAVRVAAGAPVPDGADAVVPLGAAGTAGHEVTFTAEVGVLDNLRPAGSRIADGDLLAAQGTELTPRVLGLIAEVGHDKVLVRPRPRVVVMTADSSLVEPGLPLTRRSESYDACTTLLAATARRDGAQVFGAGIVAAEPRVLGTALGEQLLRADLVLLVAQGSDDLVATLGREGAVDVAEVDGLPGRQLFALLGPDRTPVLVLPAGPVPAYLAYLLLGRALVRRLAGAAEPSPRPQELTVAADVPADPEHTRLVLARQVDGGVRPLPDAEPGAAELSRADVVLAVPPGSAPVPVGGVVPGWPLG